jgi:hypothetical protein
MGEEFVSLNEAIKITGLSREELEKHIAEGTLRSFLQEGKQLFRREDILKLKEKAPQEKAPEVEEAPPEGAEGILELLEEGQELSLVPEEEEASARRKVEKGPSIEVPGLEEEKAEEEEVELVFEADDELKVEPPVEGVAKGPVPFKEGEEEVEEEKEEVPSTASEALEEMEEAGEELGEEEVRELAELEETPDFARALLRPTVRPGLYLVFILSLIFLVICAITLVSNVLGVQQSIIQPFLKLFTG